jgi:MFS family permease
MIRTVRSRTDRSVYLGVPLTVSTTTFAVHDRLTPRARGLLLVLCGAMFLDALDVSMKGVALPSIGADLGLSTGSLQWVVSGYVLGFGGFLLLGGRAADLLGRRRMLIGALAVFAVATALGGFATDGPLLIAARFATGVSAAFSAPAGFSIITTSFAEGPVRNKALSIYTATGATGFSLGLVVGGLLTELSWRWVFHAPVVVALATLAGALAVVPRSSARGGRGFDIAGSATITAAMLLLVFTLVEAPNAGWASVRTLGSLAAVAVLLGAFVAIERRVAHPLVRLSVLRSGALVRANVGAMSLLGGWVSALFVVTLYLQQFRGWSALETGLAVCPSGLVVALLAPRIAAPLVGRYGSGRVALVGLTSSVAAYALLRLLDGSSGYVTLMLPAFLLVGLAFTLTYGPLTMAAADSVPAADQGLAGGLVNTSFQVGPALALGVVSAVQATGADLLGGLQAALVVPLVVAALGVAAMLPSLRRS